MIDLQKYLDKYIAQNKKINRLVSIIVNNGKFDYHKFINIADTSNKLFNKISHLNDKIISNKLIDIYKQIIKFKIDNYHPIKLGYSFNGEDHYIKSDKIILEDIYCNLDVLKLNHSIFRKVNIKKLNEIYKDKPKNEIPIITKETLKNDVTTPAFGSNNKIQIGNIHFIFMEYQAKFLINRMMFYHLDEFDEKTCLKIIKLTEMIYKYNQELLNLIQQYLNF